MYFLRQSVELHYSTVKEGFSSSLRTYSLKKPATVLPPSN
jgi:hypothetical protein